MLPMTLGEGKEKVYQLLDEYSSGGTVTTDEDIENKMANFFDIAQKHVAQIRRIRRAWEIENVRETVADAPAEVPMPAGFLKLIAVWRDGKRYRGYRWKAGKLVIPAGDTAETIEIEYFALPETITGETADSYEFEVREEAANALPFFVAAQQLITDLVIDYAGLYAIYNDMLNLLAKQESEENDGGAGLMNTLFRR